MPGREDDDDDYESQFCFFLLMGGLDFSALFSGFFLRSSSGLDTTEVVLENKPENRATL